MNRHKLLSVLALITAFVLLLPLVRPEGSFFSGAQAEEGAFVLQQDSLLARKTKRPTRTPYRTATPRRTITPAPSPTPTPVPGSGTDADPLTAPRAERETVEAYFARIVQEDGSYTDREHVAAYLVTYGHLPQNYITKGEAQRLGWDSSRGNLWQVAPGKSIGGDRFGNYEGLLPRGTYRECDIDYQGGYRGSKRIIFGTDGSVYYTEDHYNTFERIYPEGEKNAVSYY